MRKQHLFRKVTALTATAAMALSSVFGGVLTASAETITADEAYAEGYDINVQLEAEGAVLLKNEDSVLPLAEGTKVTILGAMSYNYVEGGTGSAGGADDENTVMMNDAFIEAGLDVNSEAWDWLEEQCGGYRGNDDYDPAASSSDADDEFAEFTSSSGDWTSYTSIHEFSIDVYESGSDALTADGYTDYAIVTFSRSGAEGASPSMDYDGDGSTLTGTTYLELDDNEKALLEYCAANYAHTIVLINSATQMELGFVDDEAYNIDACLWIGHPGEAGLVGVGTILTGRTTPSGHLADTYAYDMTTNPTYYNTDNNSYANADGQTFYQYEEGIYVGYRYYETAAAEGYFDSEEFTSIEFKNGSVSGYDEVVQYPFGYGLSYTTFEKEIVASDVTLTEHGTNSITVKVTNTGDYSGKEVVQLYMEAPYQSDTENFGIKGVGLEKAKVVLVGFEKTAELEPGESVEVTITFETDNLASYDNYGQGCYVLELGEYKFNIQDDAHQWGEEGSDNAADDSISVELATSIIYNNEETAVTDIVENAIYAGARSSDETVALNALDDVTAGDGNMLDGYLSRSDFASGMASIMSHESNEAANETVTDEIATVLALTGTDSYEYTFSTYIGGVLTEITETLYAHGNNMMPWAETTPDGQDAQALGEDIVWGATYYVIEGETTESGLPVVVEEEPTEGSYHKLSVDDMTNVPIDTEEGLAIWDMLASEVTLAEAIEVQGNAGWSISAIDSVGKSSTISQDGPGEPGNGQYAGGTWYACAVTIASTWNKELAYLQGVSYGNQCVLFGISEAYAPAMNTHRSPFGGRNFEYYSEDGLLAGYIGGNAVAGIESTGTSVFIKHMALNDGDTNRNGNTTWASEQAIREIYLLPYEISVKEYDADGIMGSLNRIGMSWFHYGMYTTILRSEWGFEGMLITDGDGGSGDVYNTPQAMMSVQGSMLGISNYINADATVAAYGDATEYAYANYMLHNIVRNCLYQYVGPVTTETLAAAE